MVTLPKTCLLSLGAGAFGGDGAKQERYYRAETHTRALKHYLHMQIHQCAFHTGARASTRTPQYICSLCVNTNMFSQIVIKYGERKVMFEVCSILWGLNQICKTYGSSFCFKNCSGAHILQLCSDTK